MNRSPSGLRVLDGRLRVAFVLFGGMVALQSSQSFDATKIAYLVGTLLCLLGALAAVWGARRTTAVELAASWLVAGAALAALLALSFLVARAEGTSLLDWARDAAGYGLFAAVPVLALDAHASSSRRFLVALLVVAGLLGGLSWAVEWLSRRHVVDLPLGRLVFPSGQLPSLLYLFAIATALTSGGQSTRWAVLAGVVLGLFLITGTRSSLLLLVGPLVMVAYLGRTQIRASVRPLLLHGAIAVALVMAVQFAVSLPTIEGPGSQSGEPGSPGPAPSLGPIVVGERIVSLRDLVEHPGADPSVRERAAQYEAAWALFVSSPIVGVGPGHSIMWINVSGVPRSGFTADTPLVMPAKLGLLGVLVFLGAAVAYGSTVAIGLRRFRRSAISLTLIGYGIWTIVGLPLGFPIEDKGASLALILLLALASAESAAPDAMDAVPFGRARCLASSRHTSRGPNALPGG